MNGLRWAVVLAALCTGFPTAARGQTLTVSTDPGQLVIATAVAGFQPDPDTDNTTTYSITTVAATSRIQARLDVALPPGVTLELTLEAPSSGGTSLGPVALTTLAQDVVTGIPAGTNESGLAITYTLSATVAAAAGTGTPQVTLTLASP